MTTKEIKDEFITKALRLMFDMAEDLEFIEVINDAKMMGFDSLAKQFVSELNETERFLYEIHVKEVNQEFSDN